MERLETGIVQDGDDWPGVFIRGDWAFAFIPALNAALEKFPDDGSIENMLTRSGLKGMLELMEASNVHSHNHDPEVVQKITRVEDA